MTKKNADPVTKRENYGFHYHFSEEELTEKSKQLARECSEREGLEDEKKSAMSDFKAKIDGKNSIINVLSNHINTGKEYVHKTCECHYDFDKGMKTYFYEDKIVGQAKMTANDLQLNLQD